MTRHVAWYLLAAAALAGTLSDRVPARVPHYAAGYRVLQGDFHIHTFPFSASSLTPWDVVLEARRQNLDVLAITGHNETVSGKVGRWFARLAGGPRVIAGEEIHGPRYHLIALGIRRTIDWRLPAADAIEDVHRQGGVAIAAHPVPWTWAAFAAGNAIAKLDGAEVAHPMSYLPLDYAASLRDFYRRSGAAAIGSSDFHGMAPPGLCRTFLFVTGDSEAAILDAIRARRTVVLDRGAVFGNLALARAAGTALHEPSDTRGPLAWFNAISGVAGLLAFALSVTRKEPCSETPPHLRASR